MTETAENRAELNMDEMLEEIMKARISDPKGAMALGERIIEMAKDMPDADNCYGVAYYCMADASVVMNQIQDFTEYIVTAIAFLRNADNRPVLARAYNVIAIQDLVQGNYPAALDNYTKALAYSGEEAYYEKGLIQSNIAEMYGILGDIEHALDYYGIAIENLRMDKTAPYSGANIANCTAQMGKYYAQLGDLGKVRECLEKLDTIHLRPDEANYNGITVKTIRVMLLWELGEKDKAQDLLKDTIEHLDNMGVITDTYNDMLYFAEFLDRYDLVDEFETVIDYIEKEAKETGVANMRLQILNLRLKYEKKHAKKEQYRVHLEEFFELFQWQQIAGNKMNLRAVELGIALADEERKRAEVERQNKILETRSTHDAITGLPNRYALNEYAEAAFERAYQNQTLFAIELLDVDCFKQYNDSYGHQKGDECLQMVADALKEVASQDGIFAARFGGDEFAIIYEDFSDEDIKQIAEQLRLRIMNQHVPNTNSDVMPFITISQGIRNSVPTAGNKVWDFLYGADNALYHVKRSQKNSVHLVHKVTKVLYE